MHTSQPFRRFAGGVVIALAALVASPAPSAQNGTVVREATGQSLFSETDLRAWLTDLSSDLMQGRAVFTEGYGLASAYIAGELRALGVKPMGDNGSYFQSLTKT